MKKKMNKKIEEPEKTVYRENTFICKITLLITRIPKNSRTSVHEDSQNPLIISYLRFTFTPISINCATLVIKNRFDYLPRPRPRLNPPLPLPETLPLGGGDFGLRASILSVHPVVI